MNQTGTRNNKTLKRLFQVLAPYRKTIFLAALLFALVAVVNLAILWNVRGLVDKTMVHRDMNAISATIRVLLALFFLQTVLSMMQNYILSWVGQRMVNDFKSRLFNHMQALSLGFFTRRRTGEIISRLTNDVTAIQKIATGIPVDLAKHTVTLFGGLGILFYMNWKLCLITIGVVPFLVVVAKGFGKNLKKLSTKLQDGLADNSTLLEEVVSGIRIVKSFVREEETSRKFSLQLESIFDISMQKSRVLAVFVPVITFLTLTAAAMVLWYGSVEIVRGNMTPGDLISFVLYGGILMLPFSAFARIFSQVKEVQGATERVFEILDEKSAVYESSQARSMTTAEGNIRFNRVSFGYDAEREILKDISFSVGRGEVVAIVGPSGAGKTTLVNLLHRFYDPQKGSIELDGTDIREIRLKDYYGQLGLVPQETFLFGGTIRENILYGKEGASEEEMARASKAAHADEFIRNLPGKYDTIVGEKGVNLSGGQRQRIAIARAILKNPRILILDEATSSLDNESETLIQDALDHFMKDRTTFIIAHRLSTIQSADRILVMEKGRLVEAGTHDELMLRRGLYYRLYTVKMSGLDEAEIPDVANAREKP